MKKMLNNFLRKITFTCKYIGLIMCMLLVLVAGMQSVKAQINSSCVINGVTVTASGTAGVGYTSPGAVSNGGCPTSYVAPGGILYWSFDQNGYIRYTFSAPIISASVRYTTINSDDPDVGQVSVNGGGTVTLSNPCNVTISSGTTLTGSIDPGIGWGDASITVTSTLPFTTITLTPLNNNTGWVTGNLCDITLVPACAAGTTAPILSATTKANICPATTVDLTSITASNLPASSTLTWHTATPATTANKIATPSAVAAGTYYAAFFDATNNCYSGTSGSATTAVTATVASCSTPVTVGTPAVITGITGTTVTGNPPTGVSGGTGPYTYSDGTGDALCTAPVGPTLALPAGRIIGLVSSTGAHSINTTGLGVGTYQYCIKLCDSTGTNCAISKHTIVVTAACNAGSAAPSLIKN